MRRGFDPLTGYMKNVFAIIGIVATAYLGIGVLVVANEVRREAEAVEFMEKEELLGGVLIWPFIVKEALDE